MLILCLIDSSHIFGESNTSLLPTFELGKREMMAMPLLATAVEEVDGRGGREEESVPSPSPFSAF